MTMEFAPAEVARESEACEPREKLQALQVDGETPTTNATVQLAEDPPKSTAGAQAEGPAQSAQAEKTAEIISGERAGDEEDDGDDTDEPVASPPRTRGVRSRMAVIDESDMASEKSNSPPRRQSRTRKAKEKAAQSTKASAGKPSTSKARGGSRTSTQKSDNETDDEPGEYIHVEVGDCVLLDSGDPEDHYIALVSSVRLSQVRERPGTFTAQWYYKPDDVREDVLDNIPGGALENEVFLSPHKDKNSMDAILGICNIVPREEYDEIQSEIKRGFREKSQKPLYVCRFKYYPTRSLKKTLEPLSDEDIRGGLGPQKPKVGKQYQATIPELEVKPMPLPEDLIPWKRTSAEYSFGRDKQVWSRHTLAAQELVFRQYRELIDPIRFAVGNVVKMFVKTSTSLGHVRCIVLKFLPRDTMTVCTSTGEVKTTFRGDVCSPLTDDIALAAFYTTRFNLSNAVSECTRVISEEQLLEREAFKQEVLIFAQVAAQEKARQAAAELSNHRKRRK